MPQSFEEQMRSKAYPVQNWGGVEAIPLSDALRIMRRFGIKCAQRAIVNLCESQRHQSAYLNECKIANLLLCGPRKAKKVRKG